MYRVKYQVSHTSALRLFAGTLIAATLFSSSTSFAEEQSTKIPAGITQTSDISPIEVVINEVTLVNLNDKIADALIGNPAIADITMQTSTSFVITGKSYGRTNIILLNKKGQTIFNKSIFVDDDAHNIVRLQKGNFRISYTCTPGCQPTPTLGDHPSHQKDISSNMESKMKEIGQAISLTSAN